MSKTTVTADLVERLEQISHLTDSGLCDNAAMVWKTAMDAAQEIKRLRQFAADRQAERSPHEKGKLTLSEQLKVLRDAN